MAIVDTMLFCRNELGMSQKEMAEALHIHPSYVSKILSGDRPATESLDVPISKMNWRLALAVIDERTGGWIRSRFKELDPHPSALKEELLKELEEAYVALKTTKLANRKKCKKQQQRAREVRKEIRDAIEVGLIMYGVIGEVYELDDERGIASTTEGDAK